jgi:hypothetical protein
MHAERTEGSPPRWRPVSSDERESPGQGENGRWPGGRPVADLGPRLDLRALFADSPGADAANRVVLAGLGGPRVVVRCPRLLATVGTATKRLRPAKFRAGHEEGDHEEDDEGSHGKSNGSR